MSNMRQILMEEVSRKGTISFARFMELALYCPNSGYYEQLDASPGRQGDFYTSVSVGELFGELLANQFAEWLAPLPVQGRQIVEAGAHDGQMSELYSGPARKTRHRHESVWENALERYGFAFHGSPSVWRGTHSFPAWGNGLRAYSCENPFTA